MSETEALRAFERKLVRHCAPTLAGIKPGSLFNCCTHSCKTAHTHTTGPASLPLEDIACIVEHCRAKLAPFGVKLDVLSSSATGVLIYAWRPHALQAIFADDKVSAFMAGEGYDTAHASTARINPTHADTPYVDTTHTDTTHISRYIDTLRERIHTSRADARPCACTFPHEIGIFLGYPLADVVGFIENKGENYLCCGYWKAYTNADRAQATFAHWRKCSATSLELFDDGVFIEDIVAALQDYPMLEALDCAS